MATGCQEVKAEAARILDRRPGLEGTALTSSDPWDAGSVLSGAGMKAW